MAHVSQAPIAPPVRAVFEVLGRAGVRWCLLRGERPGAHDLDLLVAREDIAVLAAAVRPLGFVAVPTPLRGSHQFFVSYVPSLDQWLILDVVTELSFGPDYSLRTRAASGCLARREAVGPLVVPSEDDAFWALLLHRMLDRGSFRSRDQERLHELVRGARTDGPLARFAAAICPGDGDPAAIVAAVRRSQWGELSALGGQLVASWRRKHVARFTARRVMASVAWRLGPIVWGLARPGLRVALVAEEAGAANDQAAALARSFYLPVTPFRAVEVGSLDARRVARPKPVARRLSASALRCIVARLHQLRGRLVVLPVAASASERAGTASRAAAPGFRAQVVLDVRHGGANGSAPGRKKPGEERYLGVGGIGPHCIESDGTSERDPEALASVGRELNASVWRAYCERRG
jgi:hypothetical protein